jgi:hypothetical protein
MQPVILKVKGDFWDSHVYRGRLYLWGADNSLHIFRWDAFIHQIACELKAPLLVPALARGDSLYHDFIFGALAQDEDIRSLTRHKLEELARLELTFSLADLEPYRLASQLSPFQDLHNDLVIFRNTAFALTETGFFSASAHAPKRRKFVVDKPIKHWDGRGVSLSAGRYGILIAAESDGLFEYSSWYHPEPERIAERHVSFANWLFASVYASSMIREGYLAAYRWTKYEDEDQGTYWRRERAGILDARTVFRRADGATNRSLTWGSQEKLYYASADRIKVVKFVQKYALEEECELIGEFSIRNGSTGSMAQPLSAGASFFGSVVEYADCLYIVETDLTVNRIAGAATRWRIFPRSRWYLNQLHVVLDDHLLILSLNSDLFSDQRSKVAGIEYRTGMLDEMETSRTRYSRSVVR